VPCCKAKKYGWCKDLRSLWASVDYKEYCVFHAPEADKGQTPENFNKLVHEKIQEAIDNNAECDLSGTIFPWHIDFSHFNKDNPFPQVYFNNVVFQKGANFDKATFSGDVSFDGSTFSWDARFFNTDFKKNASFTRATFTGRASFTEANFSETAFFYETTFRKTAHFYNTTFREVAHFYSTSFRENAIFIKANFKKVGYAHFSDAIFSKEANFINATFSGDVKFTKGIFNGDVYFRTTKFENSLYLGWCSIKTSMYFEGVDLSNVSFLDSNPLRMHFTNCTWPQRFGRNALSDEVKPKDGKLPFDKVEYLYRRLKQKYKEEHNETEASNWHYGEKEMFRKKKWWRRYNPVSFSNLYWFSSGYGERPIRAGLVILLLFVAVTILMSLFGLDPKNGMSLYGVEPIKGFSSVFEPKKFWLLINNTIQHALFVRDTYFIPQSLAGSIILTLSTKLIMPIQTALFVLALRNKFRR
jgi:uncharacterized protein YjbI with pentapeptide repeats